MFMLPALFVMLVTSILRYHSHPLLVWRADNNRINAGYIGDWPGSQGRDQMADDRDCACNF